MSVEEANGEPAGGAERPAAHVRTVSPPARRWVAALSERQAGAVMELFSAPVCLTDGAGIVLAANQAWRDLVSGCFQGNDPWEGADYLSVCTSLLGAGASGYIQGVRRFLYSQDFHFERECFCEAGGRRYRFNAEKTRFHEGGRARLFIAHFALKERWYAPPGISAVERVLRMLNAIGRSLLRAKEETTLYREVCRVAVNTGGFLMAAAGVVDPDDECVVLVASAGWTGVAPAPSAPLPVRGGCVQCTVLSDGRAVDCWPYRVGGAGAKAVLQIPITRAGETSGYLSLAAGLPDSFDDDSVALLEELGANIGFVLERFDAEREQTAVETVFTHGETQLAIVQQIANLGTWELDFFTDHPVADGWRYSEEAARILGYSPDGTSMRQETLFDAICAEERAALRAAFARCAATGERYEGEHRIVLRDGTQRVVQVLAAAQYEVESGRVRGMIGTVQDITERKRYQDQIEYMATHDAVTDLPNRNLLEDRVAQAIALAEREQRRLALLIVGIDEFKVVNETLGPMASDKLLRDVAERLRGLFRTGDTVARLGGDEFAVLLATIESARDAGLVASYVLAAFLEPFHIAGRELHLSVSVGASLYPEDGNAGEILLRNADMAAHRAKRQQRGSFQYYAPEMGVEVREDTECRSILRRAVLNRQFDLYFEPLLQLAGGRIYGVEIGIQWRDDRLKLLAPDRLTRLLYDIGLAGQLGEWLLRAACRHAREWQDNGFVDLCVGLRVPARQIQHDAFPGLVKQVLQETGMEGRCLNIELIEAALFEDGDAMGNALHRLRAAGARISLANFGTGYSSLSYLKRFPIDVIKIDGSFIHDVTFSVDDAMIVKATIAMAHSLNIRAVAVDVRTPGQAGFLRENGCDGIQGPYTGGPLEAAAFLTLLERECSRPAASECAVDCQRTLLLVDDEENILSALRRVLRREGYRILVATSARDAFEILATQHVGVVISDQRMQEMSGVEFFRRVRELYPDTIRVMLSGYTELQSVTNAINEGAIYKFLTKPWEDDQLIASLADAFRRYESERENQRQATDIRDVPALPEK